MRIFRKSAQNDKSYGATNTFMALNMRPLSVSRRVESGENILDNKKDVAVKTSEYGTMK